MKKFIYLNTSAIDVSCIQCVMKTDDNNDRVCKIIYTSGSQSREVTTSLSWKEVMEKIELALNKKKT